MTRQQLESRWAGAPAREAFGTGGEPTPATIPLLRPQASLPPSRSRHITCMPRVEEVEEGCREVPPYKRNPSVSQCSPGVNPSSDLKEILSFHWLVNSSPPHPFRQLFRDCLSFLAPWASEPTSDLHQPEGCRSMEGIHSSLPQQSTVCVPGTALDISGVTKMNTTASFP